MGWYGTVFPFFLDKNINEISMIVYYNGSLNDH